MCARSTTRTTPRDHGVHRPMISRIHHKSPHPPGTTKWDQACLPPTTADLVLRQATPARTFMEHPHCPAEGGRGFDTCQNRSVFDRCQFGWANPLGGRQPHLSPVQARQCRHKFDSCQKRCDHLDGSGNGGRKCRPTTQNPAESKRRLRPRASAATNGYRSKCGNFP
jgi:hypothetical protein